MITRTRSGSQWSTRNTATSVRPVTLLAVILNEDDGEGRGGFMGWFSGVHSKQLDMVGDVILLDNGGR